MNCQRFLLKQQWVKLLKIENVPLFYFNAKNDALNTYSIVTYISVIGQPQTASPLRFSSHTAHYSVLNFPRKSRYEWIPYCTGAPHVCETATNDSTCTLAIKTQNNLRVNVMVFAIQKYSNMVKRKKHTLS